MSQKEYDIINLINEGCVYKQKFNDDILNGIIYKVLDDKKVVLGNLKNGKKMVYGRNGIPISVNWKKLISTVCLMVL